jgi:hypothetical protein
MPTVESIAILRMVQLIIGVLAGFGCLYLGYRLFSQASTGTNSGSFKIPGFGNVNLKAAPGIFFALIGAVIIYASVARTMTITDDDDYGGGGGESLAHEHHQRFEYHRHEPKLVPPAP